MSVPEPKGELIYTAPTEDTPLVLASSPVTSASVERKSTPETNWFKEVKQSAQTSRSIKLIKQLNL